MDPDPVSAGRQNAYGRNRKPGFSSFRARELAHLFYGTRAGPFNINNSDDKPVNWLSRTVNQIYCRPASCGIALQLTTFGAHFWPDHHRNESRLSQVTFNTSLLFVFVASASISVNLKKGKHQRANSAKRGYPGRNIPELRQKLHAPSIAAHSR